VADFQLALTTKNIQDDVMVVSKTKTAACKGIVHPQKIFFKYVMFRTITKNSSDVSIQELPVSV